MDVRGISRKDVKMEMIAAKGGKGAEVSGSSRAKVRTEDEEHQVIRSGKGVVQREKKGNTKGRFHNAWILLKRCLRRRG